VPYQEQTASFKRLLADFFVLLQKLLPEINI
jgi:hypothetical protein